MAEFNPTTTDQGTPNYSTRAPDVGPNKAFEALFTGIGNAIDAGAKTADTYVQNRIEDDARSSFEDLNKEFGVNPESDEATIPPDLIRAKDDLSKLSQANAQGKIPETYYYQQLSMRLKGLRSKYPGYEKQVDDIVQNVTGVRPANAYRDALFNNIQNANAQLASEENKWGSWLNQNGDIASQVFPDVRTNPEKYADPAKRAEVQTTVDQYNGRVKVAMNNAAMFNADQTVAAPARSQAISAITNGHLQGVANDLDLSNANSMVSKALSDNKITPDERAQINNYIIQVRTKVTNDIYSRNGRNEFGAVKTADLNADIDAALAPINEIQKAINSDDFSAAAIATNNLKLQSDQATLDLMKQYPQLATANAVKSISMAGADTIVADIINNAGGGQEFLNSLFTQKMSISSLDGKFTPTDGVTAVDALQGRTPAEKEKMIGSWINGTLNSVQSGSITPEKTKEFVNTWYKGDAVDKLFQVVSSDTGTGQSQKLRLYKKLFDPKMTKAVKDSGDPAALATYIDAAMDKAQQIPEFRTAASDVEEIIPFNKYTRVQYDTATDRLKVFINHDAMEADGLFQRADQRAYSKRLEKAAAAYNDVLSVIAPIVEAEGGDELEGIKAFSQNLSLNLGGEFQKNFLWSINEALRGVGSSSEPPNPDTQGTFEEVIPEGTADEDVSWTVPDEIPDQDLQVAKATGDYSGVLNLIGAAEGTDKGRGYNETLDYGRWTGGDVDLTKMTINDVLKLQAGMLSNPANRRKYHGIGSSAVGRYQIVSKTLRGLVRKMGLKGNELFDEAMQDQMARILIEGRGGRNASTGNLRSEWEGLKRVSPSRIASSFNEA